MSAKLGAVTLVVAAAFLAPVARQPSDFCVARTAVIAAPPAVVFAQITDLRRWVAWSPYEALDPDLRRTYAGPASGVGAVYHWAGNAKAGAGRMTVIESVPGARVVLKVELTRPFAVTNQSEVQLAGVPGGTAVTWVMRGHDNLIFRAFARLVNRDELVGNELSHGLAALAGIVETTMASALVAAH